MNQIIITVLNNSHYLLTLMSKNIKTTVTQ